ncbi:dynactin p62 family-domain-containing protein [Hyaloraphidium curvatum]|nr:dynactin p62 family-domain-containing protein [Hyaloraphidium curvatum]
MLSILAALPQAMAAGSAVRPATDADVAAAAAARLSLAAAPPAHASSSAWFDAPPRATPPRPSVRYACPCAPAPPESSAAEGSNRADSHPPPAPDASPPPPFSPFSAHPLDALLFCDRCRCPRCPRCTADTPGDAYCPGCLFDAVSSGPRADGGRCVRHCFSCPQCGSYCSVVPVPASAGQGEKYVVQCPHCRWDSSLAPGAWIFDKPTGLGAFAASRAASTPASAAFASLKAHVRAQLPAAPKKEQPGRVAKLLQRAARKFGAKGAEPEPGEAQKAVEWRDPAGGGWEEPEGVDGEEAGERYAEWMAERAAREREEAYRAREAGQVTTPAQRLSQPDQPFSSAALPPPRLQLRAKRTRRCAACSAVLARPEGKPADPRFRIRVAARDHIPRLTLFPPLPAPGEEGVLLLRVENPTDAAMRIAVSVRGDGAAVLRPALDIGPRLDEGLYDDPPAGDGDREAWVEAAGTGDEVRRRNWALVGVRVGKGREVAVQMEAEGVRGWWCFVAW